MSLTYASFRDAIEALLGDSSNAIYTTAELDVVIAEGLKEYALYKPNIVPVEVTVEARYGTASSTSTSHLVDATKVQFLSTDVGKVIYNSTDKTWAVVTAYTSTSDVTLSADIMASGESYYIFNEDCTNACQLNIENVTDYVGIESVEFPIGRKRSFTLNGDILEIQLDYTPGDTSLSNADKIALISFNKRHKLSQLTDFAGAVNNAGGYAAGSTSMAVNGLQASGTIEADQEFTVAGIRGTYTVTSAATISTNAATISFYPGLQSAVANSAVVNFKQSSLKPQDEQILENYIAGKAAVSKALSLYHEGQGAIAIVATAATAIGNMSARLTQAITDIAAGRTETAKISAILDEANTEADLMNAQVDLAVTALSSGNSLINTIPLGGGASEYMAQARTDVNNAIGFMQSAAAKFREAQGREEADGGYLRQTNGQLSIANSYLSQAIGYLREIGTKTQIAQSGRLLEQWGQNKMGLALSDMRKVAKPKVKVSWDRS